MSVYTVKKLKLVWILNKTSGSTRLRTHQRVLGSKLLGVNVVLFT